MQMKSFDGRPVHVGLTDGSAITVIEAREVPEKFVNDLLKTGRVIVIHDEVEAVKPAPRTPRTVKPHDDQ